jgi:hypothetical protein
VANDEVHAEMARQHQAERLSHGLYGLIIVTATLGAERAHVTNARDAALLMLSTAFVLFLAHTYSAWMAERAVERGNLSAIGRRLILTDNLPVAGAIIVPMVLFALVGAGVMGLQMAYRGAIAFSLAALFGVGLYQARLASLGWFSSVASGLASGSIGVIVVMIEAFFD